MHTISETGHTGDVLAATHAIAAAVQRMDNHNDGAGLSVDDLKNSHPRLDLAQPLGSQKPTP